MSEWYYTKGGIRFGPIDVDDLRQLVASGRVGASEYVWREGMPQWVSPAATTELAIDVDAPITVPNADHNAPPPPLPAVGFSAPSGHPAGARAARGHARPIPVPRPAQPRVPLIVLMLVIPFVGLFVPSVPLWTAGLVLLLLILYLIPPFRNPLRPVFRTNAQRPIRGMLKLGLVTAYCAVLVAAALGSRAMQRERHARAEKLRVEQAERARLVNVANQKVDTLYKQAVAMLSRKDVSGATRSLEEAKRIPHAENTRQATVLLHSIEMSADAGNLRQTLLNISEAEFNGFSSGKSVPAALRFDSEVLTDRAVKLARAQVATARAQRVERARQLAAKAKREQLAEAARAEAKRRAREREAAEARAIARAAAEERAREIDRIVSTAFGPEDLVDEYMANEVAADQRLKGKLIAVTGEIDTVGKDILDTPYVSLRAGEEFSLRGVQCFFSKADIGELARLSKGQKVTIQGTCKGLMMNVLIENCSVIAKN